MVSYVLHCCGPYQLEGKVSPCFFSWKCIDLQLATSLFWWVRRLNLRHFYIICATWFNFSKYVQLFFKGASKQLQLDDFVSLWKMHFLNCTLIALIKKLLLEKSSTPDQKDLHKCIYLRIKQRSNTYFVKCVLILDKDNDLNMYISRQNQNLSLLNLLVI